MQCPDCGSQNRNGTLFCENCGYMLFDQDAIATKKLAKSRHEVKNTDVNWDIALRIRGGEQAIPIEASAEIIFGRAEPDTSQDNPDVDLTPYGGAELGVSRLHAVLYPGQAPPQLIDIGSTNGTFVNGQKLMPNQPCLVQDGDEIRLGRLVTRIILSHRSAKTNVLN
jgi:hypothetical protein